MWERLESLAEEIKNAWCTDASRGAGRCGCGPEACTGRFTLMECKQHFGMVTEELEDLRACLEEARADPSCSAREVRRITDRVDELLYREEMMWLQAPALSDCMVKGR